MPICFFDGGWHRRGSIAHFHHILAAEVFDILDKAQDAVALVVMAGRLYWSGMIYLGRILWNPLRSQGQIPVAPQRIGF